MKTLSIIVSLCAGTGNKLRVFGRVSECELAIDTDRLNEAVEGLKKFALAVVPLNGKNHHITVRPNFNEVTPEGEAFFREWRSAGGEAFKEVRWMLESSFAASAVPEKRPPGLYIEVLGRKYQVDTDEQQMIAARAIGRAGYPYRPINQWYGERWDKEGGVGLLDAIVEEEASA